MEIQNHLKEYPPTKCCVVQEYSVKALLKENSELKNRIEHLKNDFQTIIDQMLILRNFINDNDQKTKNKFEKIKMIVTILKKERECLLLENRTYCEQIVQLTKEYDKLHRLLEKEDKLFKNNRITKEEDELLYKQPFLFIGTRNRNITLSGMKQKNLSYSLQKTLGGVLLQDRNSCKKGIAKKYRTKHKPLVKRQYMKSEISKLVEHDQPTAVSYNYRLSASSLLPLVNYNENHKHSDDETTRKKEQTGAHGVLLNYVEMLSNDTFSKEKKESRINKKKQLSTNRYVLQKYNHNISGNIERIPYPNKKKYREETTNIFDSNKVLPTNSMILKYDKGIKNGITEHISIQKLACFTRELFDICTSSKKKGFQIFNKRVCVYLKNQNIKKEAVVKEPIHKEPMVHILYKLMSVCIEYIKELICDYEKKINEFEVKINNIAVFSNDIITQIKDKTNSQQKNMTLFKEILIATQNIIIECEYH